MAMRIHTFGNTINGGTVDDVITEIRKAEGDGFHGYWTPQIFSHDALTVLAVAGREVPRIELGTNVVPTYPRHPMMLAQQALTVNAATAGRLTLGIGLSHQPVIEDMMGMSFDKPVRHLREYLSVLGPMMEGGPVHFDGEVYRVHAGVEVKGGQAPPVVVAALGPQMLRVAGELAAGTTTWCTGPVTLRDHTVPTIRAAAEEAERPAPRIVSGFPVCVTEDVAGAKERAAKMLVIYGQLPSYRAMLDREGVDGPADLAIVGTAAEVVDRISALADVGVTDFVASEFGGNPDEVTTTRAALKQLIANG